MNAYHSKEELKVNLVASARLHELEDRYVRDSYLIVDSEGEWRGCSQGCTVASLQELGILGRNVYHGDHAAVAAALGLPVFLVKVSDLVFESLPFGKHIPWTGDLYEAIQVGKDLETMQHDFLAWLLNHERWGVAQYTNDPSVSRVAAMYTSGENFSAADWLTSAAAIAAVSAAGDAADAATYAVVVVGVLADAAVSAADADAAVAYWCNLRDWILEYVR